MITDLNNLMSTSVDYKIGFNMCGFNMGLDNKFFRIDVKCDSLKVIDDCFSKSILILLLFFHRVRWCVFDLKLIKDKFK